MDFTITENQSEICRTILDICRSKLNENVFDHDEKEVFPREKWELCCKADILGLPVPEEYGGLNQDMLTTALAIKTLAFGCMDEGLIFAICAHLCTSVIPLVQFGTENQKARYLPGLVSGAFIGGNGITEADAGSDSAAIKTRVEKRGQTYIINGAKIFVSNAPVADILVIYAKHPGGIPMANISGFIIEKQNPGMKTGQIFKKMGLRTCTLSEVILENCEVTEQALLGRERMGLLVFNQSMLWERIIMAAYHIGSMEQQFNSVLEYTRLRKQFGKKICQFENISDKLVGMRRRIETARLLLYNVCWKYDIRKAELADASMLKLHASQGKVKNSLDAVQIFGAYGYIKESLVEKQLRDSIAATIYSGTSEIQKKIISDNLEKIDIPRYNQ